MLCVQMLLRDGGCGEVAFCVWLYSICVPGSRESIVGDFASFQVSCVIQTFAQRYLGSVMCSSSAYGKAARSPRALQRFHVARTLQHGGRTRMLHAVCVLPPVRGVCDKYQFLAGIEQWLDEVGLEAFGPIFRLLGCQDIPSFAAIWSTLGF